ncbi:MAG: F0F1 ATP synthase subunit beta, partial [Dehalococcoidia bacterium]|nr:F0F1 ATP synthase subunit beta [Dehalococcoidia bacterium]
MDNGRIVQVIGTVIDVEFAGRRLPAIKQALQFECGGRNVVCEVQQHIGDDRVRCVVLAPTEGLTRGVEVQDMGTPISVPVGRETLGRLLNVLGEPIDGLGPVGADAPIWSIHRAPPPLHEQESAPAMLETGLKV